MLDRLVTEARERWGLDPAAGLQVVPAGALATFPIEPSRPLLVLPDAGSAAPSDPPAVRAAIAGRHGHPGETPIELLRRLYPADHPVGLSGDPGTHPLAGVGSDQLARGAYLPAVAPELAFGGLWTMPWISHRLRQPDGCPWDREQTHASLRKHLLEEAYEVYDALEGGATPELAGELGDLLLQVVLHAQLAAEAGVFDLSDVNAALARKIVRRHPHVFGEAEARTAADVTRQWERIKADERAGEGDATPKGALDGISDSLPALAASQEMQERAAALGYDWPDVAGVLDKVAEELAELAAAGAAAERIEEFGDLLLVVTNVGRKLGIESETALRAANRKFRARFRRVERMVGERGVEIRDLDFAALDELWDAAKIEERAEAREATR
jgi:tetrapyrrole methylase family protein / MazG family protein